MAQLFQPEELGLSNGIPVVFQNYEGAAAALYWWVRAGSADEAPHEAGFAHFLEHMLFKDASAKETGKASTGRTARVIESLGGDINAYTSFDQTVYHVTCAADHWEQVIDAFGLMAVPQKFFKEDFQREREVILEELRKNEDSPGRQLFQTLFSLTYGKHPYGKPVIGSVKTLKAAKVSDLEAFYRRNYVSSNMGLVVVGPLGAGKASRKAAILKLLEKRFGHSVLKKTAEKKRSPRFSEKPLRAEAAFKVRPFDVKVTSISWSLRVPHLLHEDVPALDLLSGILGMGELSRLYQRLFYQTSLVTEISGGLYVPNDPGMFYVQAELDSVDKVNRVSEEVFLELRRLCQEGPTEEEIRRVLVSAESEKLYATQTADGQAARLGFARFVLRDLEFDEKYLSRLRDLDSAALRDVARRYFDHRRLSGVILLPKLPENAVEQRDFSGLGAMASELLPGAPPLTQVRGAAKKAKVSVGPAVQQFELPSGIRVVHLHRAQSHVFSIHASVLGGTRLECAHPLETSETDWGVSHMMAQTWTKGTVEKDSRKIASIVEGHAAALEGFSGRNSVGLQMTGLARDWDTLSALFGEVLSAARFPEDEVEHSRRVIEDGIRSIEDQTSQLCSKLFLEALFQRHPYGKILYGDLKSVAAIQAGKLRDFHSRWVRPERLVLAISGNIRRSVLERWLLSLEQGVKRLSEASRVRASSDAVEAESRLKAPRWVERGMNREQAHILVGGLGTTSSSEDRYALRVLQTILGGQSGRLFIELREKKSLAYSVSPLSFEGIEPGYIGTYIATAPEKREEALAGIQKIHAQLGERGPSSVEMARAREYLLGRRAMDLQSDSALSAHSGLAALYGMPQRTDAEVAKIIRSVTAKEVKQVCRKYLVEPHRVTAVVG